jgi:hypothetical protein
MVEPLFNFTVDVPREEREKSRLVLQRILETHVRGPWAEWIKTLPDDYFQELFRLHGVGYPPVRMRKLCYIEFWTNDAIFSRLSPEASAALKSRAPISAQACSELEEYIGKIIFLMKSCSKWTEFIRRLDKVAPETEKASLSVLYA